VSYATNHKNVFPDADKIESMPNSAHQDGDLTPDNKG